MKKIPMTLMMLLISCLCAGADTKPVQTLQIGSAAPDFALRGVDRRIHRLRNFAKAKVLVVVFTCNHCPTAQAYEERIKQLVNDYRGKGVTLVAISPNDNKSVRLDELGYTDLGDSLADMKIRARHKQFNFPYLYDGDLQTVSRAYGPQATPHAFVFDAARKLQYVGRIDDSEREQFVKTRDLRDALDAMLAGREVANKQTRSFGCSVKWAGKHEAVKAHLEKLAAEPVSIEMADAEALKELRKNSSGKLRLINFWATWCGPCITEMPELVTINRMYRHRAFEMVFVAANFPDEKRDVLSFLQQQQASNRNLLFAGTDKYALMSAFDPEWNSAIPYTMLISPTGEVLYKEQGPVDPLELKRAIVRSLKEDRKFQ
ncbi:MAG: redoxin domain-containing protein [Pyrinomonadaceae bacterium]|nr:redoxin domain-containing protein [Pyrinomonadaceae bacterium]